MCGIMHEWIDGGGSPNPKWGHHIPGWKDFPGHSILGSSDRGHRQGGSPNPSTPDARINRDRDRGVEGRGSVDA